MNITTKAFNGQPIGITEREGKPWLIVADIAKALGYLNTGKATDRISKAHLSNITRNGYRATITNEAGLYELLVNSRKKEAQEFSQWAAREVFAQAASSGCLLGVLIEVLQQMQRNGRACSCSGGCR
ncbi:MAG TPA: Bro-N domain-containing protein [Gallionella sp.]|nr:Bro-N domain-containing protein [Gallionella sp.]